MTELGLTLPSAFNYHFDNDVFGGLGIVNFTTPEETSTVTEHMNHMELRGRKLRSNTGRCPQFQSVISGSNVDNCTSSTNLWQSLYAIMDQCNITFPYFASIKYAW